MRRIAYFGGTFDPVHTGHLSVARSVTKQFDIDLFYFLPAFHAPHKPNRIPTSAFHRFAMLVLATEPYDRIGVSTVELEKSEKRFTIQTLPELYRIHPDCELFFVMGADSWADIRTWRDWEEVLVMSNHIVATRPGYPISFDHVTEKIRQRIVDLRNGSSKTEVFNDGAKHIYISDAVLYDTSASELREDLTDGRLEKRNDVPAAVAKYIEKYELYR